MEDNGGNTTDHSTSPSPSARAGERILSTAPVGNDVMQEALSSGIELDVIPFIEVKLVDNAELSEKVNEIAGIPNVVIFTSQHAVMSVARMLSTNVSDWQIYCLGNKTLSTVNQYFAEFEYGGSKVLLNGVADDAQALANIIVKEHVKKVVFFCGDKRLDILPNILVNAGVEVEEHIVYQTIETPHKLEKEYGRILFFSPSGVNSFFNLNTVNPEVVLYAIGNTTADAIRRHTDNKIVISDRPVKKEMFLAAVGDLSPSLSKGEGEVE